jgi:AraC-like DNA-binding protein
MDREPTFYRLSLAEVPERDRAVTLKEVFGHGVVNLDFTPLTDDPQLKVEIHAFPGVAISSVRVSPFLADSGYDRSRDNDEFALVWATSRCKGVFKHLGKEAGGDGAAVLISCADRVSAENHNEASSLTVRMKRSLLLPLLPDAEAALMRDVSPGNAALRLLTTYLQVLIADGAHAQGPELGAAVAAHICDLVSLAVGTNRDAAEFAAGRGLRAARLAAVKRWVLTHLGEPELGVGAAAAAAKVGVRYVQTLFESEGTTFTDFVLAQRLAAAHRRLANPGLARTTIASIAFACGFGDLSYFNRSFRAAYGQSPSDVRRGALSNPS